MFDVLEEVNGGNGGAGGMFDVLEEVNGGKDVPKQQSQ
jgi:hypothetical protein